MIGEDEKVAVLRALNQRTLTNGPTTREFEEAFQDYAAGGIALAVSSCMAALHISCLACLKPGDEVIVPALTHPATAHAVELAGAKPVFVDVDPITGNIDPVKIRRAITTETRMIMVVHYLGKMADMPTIMSIAREHDITVIEDCALALGARGRDAHAGLYGNAGCFSFYPVKHITTGEGGMLLTKDPRMAEVAKSFRSFGLGKNLGMNYRLSEMQSVLGLTQLAKAEKHRKIREHNWHKLSVQLKDFETIDSSGRWAAYYAFTVILPDGLDRDRVRRAMNAKVETSVYYHPILPEHPYYFRTYGEQGSFPNAKRIADQSICLSCGPHLEPRQINEQVKVFKGALACMSS